MTSIIVGSAIFFYFALFNLALFNFINFPWKKLFCFCTEHSSSLNQVFTLLFLWYVMRPFCIFESCTLDAAAMRVRSTFLQHIATKTWTHFFCCPIIFSDWDLRFKKIYFQCARKHENIEKEMSLGTKSQCATNELHCLWNWSEPVFMYCFKLISIFLYN